MDGWDRFDLKPNMIRCVQQALYTTKFSKWEEMRNVQSCLSYCLYKDNEKLFFKKRNKKKLSEMLVHIEHF